MQQGNYGFVKYFQSTRCFNDAHLRKFNKNKISAFEIVCFDCAFMQMQELATNRIDIPSDQSQQILAIIVRPEIEVNYTLENDRRFHFCGYDLIEAGTGISAIINCGAEFDNAINYNALNKFGIFTTYREAVLTQLALYETYPEESHAYCEIVEIWRCILL